MLIMCIEMKQEGQKSKTIKLCNQLVGTTAIATQQTPLINNDTAIGHLRPSLSRTNTVSK